jgi:anti-sigma B factor antagonist
MTPAGDCAVVAVIGDLDYVTSPQLEQHLNQGGDGSDLLILDMSGVTFIDTSCLAVIVRIWREHTAAGGKLLLAGARYDYTRALWITGLVGWLPMYADVDEALEAARAPASDQEQQGV